MKRLIERINGLENSVGILVQKLVSLKEENKILSDQNQRLIDELNQLKRGDEPMNREVHGVAERSKNSESDINVEQMRQELDQCIHEVESCLKLL